MTSYNNIKRIKYTNASTDEYVSLIEYIFFESEENIDKFIVFKFRNNLEQYLYEVGFTVYQYNQKGELIEKSKIEYKDFKVGNYETFVPNLKFRASKDCASISVELKKALFEKLSYDDGIARPITYNYHDYLEDFKAFTEAPTEEGYKKLSKKQKKAQKEQVEKAKKEKLSKEQKKLRRKKLIVKDITKQNKPKKFAFWTIALSLIVIAINILLAFSSGNSSSFTVDGIKYEINSENNTVSVVGYTSNETTINIPRYVNGYSVSVISSKAFENSSVQSMTIESDSIVIESMAFASSSLVQFSVLGQCTVKQFAFYKCDLSEFYGPYSIIDERAFYSENKLNSLTFNSSTATTFSSLFVVSLPDGDDFHHLVTVSKTFYQRNPSFWDRPSRVEIVGFFA